MDGGSWPRGLRRYWADALLAGVLAALSLYVSLAGPGTSWPRLAPSVPFVLVTLAATVPLVWRRRYPVAVFGAVLAAQLAREALGIGATPSQHALLIALYTVAALGPRRLAYALPALLVALLGLGMWSDRASPVDPQFLLTAAVFGAVWGIGITSRARRDYTAGLEDRTRRLAAEREVRAREAVARERLRMSRELHDIVAHHVGVMVVESEVGQVEVAAADAGERFRSIGDTGRLALREMRRLVGAWRAQPGVPVAELLGAEPPPGVAGLPELADRARRAGLDVRVEVTGEPYPLSGTGRGVRRHGHRRAGR